MTKTRKKLIEVALPLEAINIASAREKSIRHGHPSTLHLWWARRPLAAARAVIFAQMVDDPSSHPELFPTEAEQEQERQRLFRLIEELVQWENTTNEMVLQRARDEIWKSWRLTCAENADHPRAKELFNPEKLPAFHDPFAGGGALPLEAQRLGLEAYASDLNPVAVLINKAMIEIPPKFAGKPPVNPEASKEKMLLARQWHGAEGLAEDVRYYGQWMRNEAEKRIGHLYPKVEITDAMVRERPDIKKYVGQKLTVIAWLWARTVRSPNPAFSDVEVPLITTFMLSTKAGKEAYLQPIIEGKNYRFAVNVGKPKDVEGAKHGTKLARGANFRCLMSGSPMESDHIKSEGRAGRMGARLLAAVAEGERGRVYLSPTQAMEEVACKAMPEWKPDLKLSGDTRAFWTPAYGVTTFGDLFTNRQLVALTTFADLVLEAKELVKRDSLSTDLLSKRPELNGNSNGGTDYVEAIGLYLAFSVSRLSMRCSSLASWDNAYQKIQNTFGRQALPMVWDFAEVNPFSSATGNYESCVTGITEAVLTFPNGMAAGTAVQAEAQIQDISEGKLVSTDPPYYDNIGYADLSDYFYVWLRRSLRFDFPDLFATLAVPKENELVATPFRHGNKKAAEEFFLQGMTLALNRFAGQVQPAFPVTIYYAFKQSENKGDEGVSRTGWETFLDAVINAGFSITGTWPIRTEMRGRVLERGGTNALASSIILVCRQRSAQESVVTRREFVVALKAELPRALADLQRGNIAPVDLAQASIGPGMAIFTRYSKVIDVEGKPLSVHESLALINQVLDDALTEQEGDFDADSRWALAWFEQMGFNDGEYGVAETLSKAKNTSVAGLAEAGILTAGRGKVRLLKPIDLPDDWDPATDTRLSAWETVHHLIRALEAGGESAASNLVAQLGSKAETARELCYRLYALCERKKRTAEALSYNALVLSWPEITRLAREGGQPREGQTSFLDEGDE